MISLLPIPGAGIFYLIKQAGAGYLLAQTVPPHFIHYFSAAVPRFCCGPERASFCFGSKPTRRPSSGSPAAAPPPPYGGSKPQTAPSICRLLAAAKTHAIYSGTVAGRRRSQKPRAPVWGRRRSRGGTAGGRVGGFRSSPRPGNQPSATASAVRVAVREKLPAGRRARRTRPRRAQKKNPRPRDGSRDIIKLWTHRAAGREPPKERRTLPPAGPWEAQAVSGTR